METLIQRFLLLLMLLSPIAAAAESRIKQIKINGLEYSKARVVERELPFKEGDIWLPEYAEIGARRLRNLGIFSEAVISPPDGEGVVNIRVNGRWPLWLLPEASRSDGGRSSVGLALTEYNLWGLNHHVRLATRRDTGDNFSENNGASYQASYIWRRINDTNYGMDISINRGTTIYDAYQDGLFSSSYFLQTTSWTTGFNYAFGPVPREGWDARLGFSSNSSAYQLSSGPPLPDIKNLLRQSVQLSASYRLINDRITWFTGSEFDYNLDIAHKAVGSDINSYGQTLSLRRHIDLGQENTLSMRVNAGLKTGEVLLDGLYDVGDGKGFRGYYPGELQGNAYIYGTLEGRYTLEMNSNVQLVGFVDVGHVSNNGSSALESAIVAGVGGGVRWTLRWLVNGTLRADVAYGSANKKMRFHFGTGQAF